VLGAIVCAVVIAGNVRRADPHLVSVSPDVVSVALAPLVVFAIGRHRRKNGESSDSIRMFGVQVGAIAGAVFAVGLGVFTMYSFAAWPLWAFGGGVAFSTVFLLSSWSAYLAGQNRITGV
jgi:hypothetical protein